MRSELQMQGFSGTNGTFRQHLSNAPPSPFLLGPVKEKNSVSSPNFLPIERRELLLSFLFLISISKYQRISPFSQGGEDTPRIEGNPYPFSAMIFTHSAGHFYTFIFQQ